MRLVGHLLGSCVLGSSLILASGCGPELPGQGADRGRTVVYRDTWGVPHIFAPTAEDGAFAQGWAQAEDRPEQVLANLAMGIGEYAAAVGHRGVEADLRALAWDHSGAARRGYDALAPEQRAALEAYADGVNAYYAAHPEDIPEWWGDRRVDPTMTIAFTRMFLYNWSINEAYGDLQRGGVDPGFEDFERGSNQFAVAPGRSAEGAAILAIDPHLPWFGPSRFWEMRLHAGELEGCGVTLPGAVGLGLGHTRSLAWAMTTGGPDTADVYRLTLKPDDPHAYLYDGEWRSMTSRQVTIQVLGSEPETHSLWFSHHGPIIAAGDGAAYAAKIAYGDEIGFVDAYWQLATATDYTGAVRAAETLAMYPQNLMVADTSGNIYYHRLGRVPVRPEGPDWSRPVDGSTSATEWLGVHPASDHLAVLNPEQGWMQNCNIPPDAMMPGSPFRLADQPTYLYASAHYGERRDGWINQRGARAIELLRADSEVTAEEAIAYINDIRPFGAARWIEALRRADEQSGDRYAEHPLYRRALADLLAWDAALAADSSGGLKYAYWREQLASDHGEDAVDRIADGIDDLYAIVRGEDPAPVELPADAAARLVASFATAMERLEATHGSLDATYGDCFRVGRGNLSWPLDGGLENGLTTLRNVGYGPEGIDGTRRAQRGQSATQVVVLTSPPRCWIYSPVGQSDRPDSPHYRDQAELAFSPRTLRPHWWQPEELAEHVESRTVLSRTK